MNAHHQHERFESLDRSGAVAQVHRLRLTARCLDLWPVFVQDGNPLVAEMFDGRGQLVEVWKW